MELSSVRIARLWAVTLKEFIEIWRDPRTLALVIFMPILLLILFGFAITLDIKEVPTAVCDRDRTPQSRALLESLFSSGYFKSVEPEACDRHSKILEEGTARVYLEIPPQFGQQINSMSGSQIQVLLDGADNNTATISAGYIEQILQGYSPVKIQSTPSQMGVEARSRIWFNPDLNSTHFITPGIIGMLIMIIAVALPAMAIVREHELGTMEVLLSSPVRPMEIILGKMLPYGIIGLGVIILISVTSVVVFHVPFRGSVFHLFWQACVFLLATLSMGLLISTIAQTRTVAYFISLLTTMLPTFILSGFIFPVESMPWALQGVSYVIPTTHFLVILRAILLKGVDITAVWPHTLYLLGFAVLLIMISVHRFKMRMT